MMRRLGHRVHFLHLRNVKRGHGRSHRLLFFESEHLDGDVDMVALIAEILKEEARRQGRRPTGQPDPDAARSWPGHPGRPRPPLAARLPYDRAHEGVSPNCAARCRALGHAAVRQGLTSDPQRQQNFSQSRRFFSETLTGRNGWGVPAIARRSVR